MLSYKWTLLIAFSTDVTFAILKQIPQPITILCKRDLEWERKIRNDPQKFGGSTAILQMFSQHIVNSLASNSSIFSLLEIMAKISKETRMEIAKNTSYRAVAKEFGISRSGISVLKLQSPGSIWNLPRCNHLQNLQYWIVTDSKSSVKEKRLQDKWWMSATYSFRC